MDDAQRPIVLSPEEYRQQQIAKARTEAAGLNLDTTAPGGRYLLADGTAVDANGQPLKDEPKAPPAPDGYDAMTVAELTALMGERSIEVPSNARKADLVAILSETDAAEGGQP